MSDAGLLRTELVYVFEDGSEVRLPGQIVLRSSHCDPQRQSLNVSTAASHCTHVDYDPRTLTRDILIALVGELLLKWSTLPTRPSIPVLTGIDNGFAAMTGDILIGSPMVQFDWFNDRAIRFASPTFSVVLNLGAERACVETTLAFLEALEARRDAGHV